MNRATMGSAPRTPVLPAVLALLLGASCSSDPATQVVIEIDAAEDVKSMASFVRLRIEASDASGVFTDVSELGDVTIPVARDGWPRVHVIAPLEADATRTYRVTARALDVDFRTVAETRRQSGYVARETRVLRLFIPGGECIGVTCPNDRTCEQGLCLEVPNIPAELLPRPGDDVDGGSDAGVADGGEDGGTCDPTTIECEPEGECETAEVSCESGEPVCVRTPRAVDVVCRAAMGECDAEELCDGVSPFCPEDAAVEFGTECSGGFCFGQTCGTCTAGGACDTGNPCEVGEIACDDEGVPTCTPMRAADPGTVCRAAIGTCDLAETCEDTTCPPDERKPAGETCRGATGLCDEAELCDGTDAQCPADTFRAANSECRASSGACDPAEVCSGSGPSCPADAIARMGQVCRVAVDELCDVSEVCDGRNAACPGDTFAPFGTACGFNPGFACDGAGNCAATSCGESCDTGRACEVGVIECDDGGMPRCVGKSAREAGTVCRPANGVCDVAETCTGTSSDCPADGFAGPSTTCRPADGPCDAPEACTGTSPACPSDALRPSGSTCRAAMGDCDRAEVCSGSSRTCPSDGFLGGTTTCRPAAGLCDLPEVCSGTSATCPTDRLRSAGDVCRVAQHPSCDYREECSGTSSTCPADVAVRQGNECMRPTGYGGVCTGLTSSDDYRCLDLVISEIRLGTGGFVELYNRFCSALALSACSLTITSESSGAEETVSLSGTIPGGGFYLVGMGLGASDTNAGATLGAMLSAGRSATFHLDCHGETIDAVELRSEATTEGGVEGNPKHCPGMFGMIGTPSNGTAERKAVMASTSTSMSTGVHATVGNPFDTNQNAMDFVCQMTGVPQSSGSTPEPMGCR